MKSKLLLALLVSFISCAFAAEQMSNGQTGSTNSNPGMMTAPAQHGSTGSAESAHKTSKEKHHHKAKKSKSHSSEAKSDKSKSQESKSENNSE